MPLHLSPETEARKVLPARSSRGTRIHKLIGEEAEADASFWGQSAWQEDGEDEDYSTEAEEEDIVDSDFDQEEVPDEEVHDADDDDEGKSRKRSTASSGRYKEPLHAKKRKPLVSCLKASGLPSVTPKYEYKAPTVRSSTAKKSSESSELRRKASVESAKLSSKLKSKPIIGTHGLTQAQLLAEAVRTEVENTQSLQRLEQLEEEKKAESLAPKAPFTGTMVRYHSKLNAPKTITFVNSDALPSIFHQPKPKKRISSQQQKLERMNRQAAQSDHESEEEEEEDEEEGEEGEEDNEPAT